ncbi:hypothetical protein TNCV_1676341 [Trichonephila clavipes]|nr:hypothetical protein TNCV_1676341 [Trichonephila clavipes]
MSRSGVQSEARPAVFKSPSKLGTHLSTHYMVSDAELQDLGSNPGVGMVVCKGLVPLQRGGTLNSRRATCPLVSLLEGEES